jgi:putative acetyltransferase
VQIVEPFTPEHFEAFRSLLREWFDYLVNDRGIDMGYQSIDAELAGLPGAYGPPRGRMWLAYDDSSEAGDAPEAGDTLDGGDPTSEGGTPDAGAPTGEAVGIVALRPLGDEGDCELKRLYVRPAVRGRGAGRALTTLAIAEARAMGYRLMRLDTGTFLKASRHLYASLGFVEIAPYYDVPPDVLRVTVYLELPLTSPPPLTAPDAESA